VVSLASQVKSKSIRAMPLIIVGMVLNTAMAEKIGDPVIQMIVMGLWLIVGFCWFLQFRYSGKPALLQKQKKSIVWWAAIVVSLSMFFVVDPVAVFAQNAAAGSGGSCSGAGFLNPLLTLSTNAFSGLTGPGADAVSSGACRLVFAMLWGILSAIIAGICFLAAQIMGDRGNLAQLLEKVVVAVCLFLAVGLVFSMAGIGASG
jgi:hypothetical protein